MKAIYQCLKLTSLVVSIGLIPLAIPALAQETESYPPEIVQSFMDWCGFGEAVCSCVIEGIQAKYSLEEFTPILKDLTTGLNIVTDDEFVTKLTEIEESCKAQEQPGN